MQDLGSLTNATVALCESFGPVRSYECVRLVHDKSEQVVLCFVELESEAQQMELIRGLGAYTFGSGVCLKTPDAGRLYRRHRRVFGAADARPAAGAPDSRAGGIDGVQPDPAEIAGKERDRRAARLAYRHSSRPYVR